MTHLFQRDLKPADLGHGRVLAQSLALTILAIGVSYLLFPGEASLIAVFLVAFGMSKTVRGLLEYNRYQIWGGLCTPRRANTRLAVSLSSIFAGILVIYAAASLLVPESQIMALFGRQVGDFGDHSITEVQFGDLSGVLTHNLAVLGICFLFALIYQTGGIMLVLAWNASVWGVVFPTIARTAPDQGVHGVFSYFLKSMVCIGPHLALEAVAYVLAAMSGVFLSKALGKYRIRSAEFRQVSGAVIKVGLVGTGILVIASLVESLLAPAMVGLIFG